MDELLEFDRVDVGERSSSRKVRWGHGVLHARYRPSDIVLDHAIEERASGFGWRVRFASEMEQPIPDEQLAYVAVRDAGWPFLAFSGEVGASSSWTTPTLLHAFERQGPSSSITDFIPLSPVPVGRLVDTVVFGGALAALASIRGAIIRRSRRVAGLCQACGHALAGSAACSECGAQRAERGFT